jgi:lipopolysaccharide/colanic/teichoic acid biosynthesis glycosyltransferase
VQLESTNGGIADVGASTTAQLDARWTSSVRSGWLYQSAKRAVDLLVASVLLTLALPAMVVVALVVRLTSPGPSLFLQVRIGERGTPFTMFKFRTMYRDNDDADHRAYVAAMFSGGLVHDGGEQGLFKLANDPRITPIGRLLRKASLDELPQLFNVLLGDMSLVGPRPALPWEAVLFENDLRVRFTVKPGITGLWQVSGRNALTMPEGLKLDAEYVARRSLALDLAILLRTIPAILRFGRAR